MITTRLHLASNRPPDAPGTGDDQPTPPAAPDGQQEQASGRSLDEALARLEEAAADAEDLTRHIHTLLDHH